VNGSFECYQDVIVYCKKKTMEESKSDGNGDGQVSLVAEMRHWVMSLVLPN
jgi:hypothetical protein